MILESGAVSCRAGVGPGPVGCGRRVAWVRVGAAAGGVHRACCRGGRGSGGRSLACLLQLMLQLSHLHARWAIDNTGTQGKGHGWAKLHLTAGELVHSRQQRV